MTQNLILNCQKLILSLIKEIDIVKEKDLKIYFTVKEKASLPYIKINQIIITERKISNNGEFILDFNCSILSLDNKEAFQICESIRDYLINGQGFNCNNLEILNILDQKITLEDGFENKMWNVKIYISLSIRNLN